MLLRSLTLENFGAYAGEQKLDLTTRPGKPVVLIGGLNGGGKTTLLDAIQLALYGPRARCSGRGNLNYESYLRDSLNRRAERKRAAIDLRFTITTEGAERLYRVVRSWTVNGKSVREFLNVYVEGEHDQVLSDGWADHVEDLLPREVASLFFFDGEKIESLADPTRAAPVIESAVHSLLGIATVEQLRTDLLALQRRQRVPEEDRVALERIKELEERLKETELARSDANQELASVRTRLQRARAVLEEIEATFAREGGHLYHQRAELLDEKEKLKEKLRNLQHHLANTVAAGPLPLHLVQKQLEQIKHQARLEQEAIYAAEVIDILSERDDHLLEILREHSSNINVGAIKKHLAADREKRLQNGQVSRIYDLSRNAIDQLMSMDHVLRNERDHADRLLTELAELEERANAVERQLAGVPDDNHIKALIEDRDRAHEDVERLTVEQRVAEGRHAAITRDLERLLSAREHAYRDRAAGLAKAEHAARILEHSDRVRQTLEKFRGALLRRHINRLEVAVLDSFNRLMRKTGLVKDLRIDTEKFTLSLTDAAGDDIPPSRLSAGERQLLAVSLLWGLARVAGNKLPTVIDTPLGRLDSVHRQHLVERYFPAASDQVLLLSTDEEIDDYLLTRLQRYIAHTYTLVHDDRTFTTTIERGYLLTPGAGHVA